jgi:hypothetical protein
MFPRLLHVFFFFVICVFGSRAPAAGQPAVQVDLALVLAVDVSLSMDEEEQKLQREGYVAAFRDSDVHRAIGSGPHGRIAVAYMEWAGFNTQSVTMPWRVIATRGEAEAFAGELAERPITRARMTSISSAIERAAQLLAAPGAEASRRVIDVSGDGPNNIGRPILAARRDVLDRAIVINGLAIQIKRGRGAYSYFDLPDLDRYYGECVIGGPGSFVLSVNDKRQFAQAIRQKLLLEISGGPGPDRAMLHKAQFLPSPRRYDCLVGEKRWRQYLEEIWQD